MLYLIHIPKRTIFPFLHSLTYAIALLQADRYPDFPEGNLYQEISKSLAAKIGFPVMPANKPPLVKPATFPSGL